MVIRNIQNDYRASVKFMLNKPKKNKLNKIWLLRRFFQFRNLSQKYSPS